MAYLPMFNDLGKNPKSIIYAADQEASGKMKVGSWADNQRITQNGRKYTAQTADVTK